MPPISQAKTLGGVGSVLTLFAVVPNVGGVLGILGFVMILIAVKCIADALNEKKIFTNMMIAVLLSVVGLAIGSLVIVGTVLNAFQNGYFSSAYPFTPSSAVTMGQWTTFGIAIALGLFGTWLFFTGSAVFLRKSYKTIGARLGVRTFVTAGLLYLLGAGTIVIGIGFLVLLAAQILTAVAFFCIPENREFQTALAVLPAN